MVLSRSKLASPDPLDPVAFVRAMRASQDEALAKGLGLSALGHLTLVVLAMLLGLAFGSKPTVKVIDGEWPAPPHPVVDVTATDPVARPPRVPVDFTDAGVVVPTKDDPLIEDLPIVAPSSEAGDPSLIRDPFAREGLPNGGVGALPGRSEIPPPNTWIVHDELPVVVHKVEPPYPEMPRQAGIEGRVTVRVFVDTNGRVRRAEIEKSSPLFDEVALEAARQWVFTPAKSNGLPVAVWLRIPIDFRLH